MEQGHVGTALRELWSDGQALIKWEDQEFRLWLRIYTVESKMH